MDLTIINQNGKLLVDSREVAEMIGKRHDHLIRDIQGYIKVISNNPDLGTSNFFIESSYKQAGNGKENPCYLLTKKGCDMVANKMTGEKGVLFTAIYVTKFEDMENTIRSGQNLLPKKLTAIEQLQLQNQAILEVNEKVDRMNNSMPLFKAECDELQSLVKKVGVGLMGGKNSSAYKNNSLSGKIYSDIQHQLRREFGVDKYSWIKHSQFERAKEIISTYKLPIVLKDEVEAINSQVVLEV